MAAHWFIAKSKPGKERYMISGLTRWEVETFYPYIRRPGKQGKLEPLFSTYIFCKFDDADPRWQAIRWTQGLSYFLTVDSKLSQLPDSFIEYLKVRTRDWNEGSFQRTFSLGQSVTIVSGPFAGLDAVFQTYVPSRQRCQVLLQAVSGITSVELPEIALAEVGNGWRARLAFDQA